MSLSINLTPELDLRLREEATKLGMDPAELVVQALRGRLNAQDEKCLNATESALLEEINCGMSEDEWTRYRSLLEKRRTLQISEDERQELIATSDRIEELNVRRMASLSRLAQLRQTALPELMADLGISPPPVL